MDSSVAGIDVWRVCSIGTCERCEESVLCCDPLRACVCKCPCRRGGLVCVTSNLLGAQTDHLGYTGGGMCNVLVHSWQVAGERSRRAAAWVIDITHWCVRMHVKQVTSGTGGTLAVRAGVQCQWAAGS